MKLNRTGSPLSRDERNKVNENWETLERGNELIQKQIDQMSKEGDSSVEAAQARVDKDGKTYETLKGRLDSEQEETTNRVTQLGGDIERHKKDENNPHKVTKSQVGLGNVDNVKQASKVEFDSLKNKVESNSSEISSVKNRVKSLEDEAIGWGVRWNFINDTYERIGKARGLTQSDFDNIYPWSDIRRCVVNNDVEVIAYHGEPGYVEDGSAGQVMVEYPEHYYKRVVNYPYIEFWINDEYAAGFELQETFKRGDQVTDKIYLGAYDGSIFDVSAGEYLFNDEQIADFTAGSGDLLCSIAGVKPASGLTQNLTIGNARNIANNRGANWGQLDFDTHSMVQMLYLIEYANFNSQATIGNGVVSKASGSGNESEITGATSFLGNKSGMAPGTNGHTPISYRGLENFWGNIYKWMDGLNIKDKVAYYNTTGMDFESDKFDGHYEYVGFEMYQGDDNPYVKMIGSSERVHHAFLGTEGGANSNSHLADRLYISNMGNRVARVGGHWNTGSNAGAFILDLLNSSTNRNRGIGARLLCAKTPLKS